MEEGGGDTAGLPCPLAPSSVLTFGLCSSAVSAGCERLRYAHSVGLQCNEGCNAAAQPPPLLPLHQSSIERHTQHFRSNTFTTDPQPLPASPSVCSKPFSITAIRTFE